MEWVKQEVKSEVGEGDAGDGAGGAGRTTAAGGEDGGEAGREAKRARTNGASADVTVKKEVKSEESMDIEFGNVAKAFGDGAEGSDATFERLWAEDPDKVSLHLFPASSLRMSVCRAQKP